MTSSRAMPAHAARGIWVPAEGAGRYTLPGSTWGGVPLRPHSARTVPSAGTQSGKVGPGPGPVGPRVKVLAGQAQHSGREDRTRRPVLQRPGTVRNRATRVGGGASSVPALGRSYSPGAPPSALQRLPVFARGGSRGAPSAGAAEVAT